VSIPVSYWRSVTGAEGIVEAVERAVSDHVVRPGDKLPTVRELATQVGLAPNTVAAAYRTLGARGIVTGRGRQGTRINAGPALPARPAPAIPAGTRDLANGNPDPALLPSWRGALQRLQPPAVSYTEAQDDLPELLDLARAQFAADDIHADRALVVPGALDGVERVLVAHLRPGDRVAVEDPGFARSFDLISALGLVALPMAVDDEGPLPDALEGALGDGATAVLLTPRAQNPTGAVLSAARARVLRRVISAHPDLLIIEDDHAGPIAGATVATLTATSRPRWAVVRSVAKSLGPDLRVAVLTGDRTTMDRVEGRLRLGTGWVSHLLQAIVVDLWSDPTTAAQIEHACATYTERREALLAALASHDIDAVGASGLNVWIPVTEEDVTISGLLARGWAVAGGERFRLRSGPAVRVTIATLSPADAARFASDLAVVLQPRRGVGASV
jgi:DNA-binding transcriptional MocR family regulator